MRSSRHACCHPIAYDRSRAHNTTRPRLVPHTHTRFLPPNVKVSRESNGEDRAGICQAGCLPSPVLLGRYNGASCCSSPSSFHQCPVLPSRKVRSCCCSQQLLVAIFNLDSSSLFLTHSSLFPVPPFPLSACVMVMMTLPACSILLDGWREWAAFVTSLPPCTLPCGRH